MLIERERERVKSPSNQGEIFLSFYRWRFSSLPFFIFPRTASLLQHIMLTRPMAVIPITELQPTLHGKLYQK